MLSSNEITTFNNESLLRFQKSLRRATGGPGYTLNNTRWPGLAKVLEETSELNVNLAKIMATFGESTYYNGEDLRDEVEKEAADSLAALAFLIEENKLDKRKISRRVKEKLALYEQWKLSNQ